MTADFRQSGTLLHLNEAFTIFVITETSLSKQLIRPLAGIELTLQDLEAIFLTSEDNSPQVTNVKQSNVDLQLYILASWNWAINLIPDYFSGEGPG